MKKKIIIATVIVLLIALVVCVITVNVLKNKMTPEETLSRFMYLIENKEYDKAKKLCSSDLEKLDVLSNIKPTNFSFDFSEDKKEAEATILENEETLEISKMYVYLDKSYLGWKINKYKVETEMIDSELIQNRLDEGKQVSDLYLLYWAMSDKTNVDDIVKYAKDNTMILTLFSKFASEKNEKKMYGLYKKGETAVGTELTKEEINDFDWENYDITFNTEFIGITSFTLKDNNKEIKVMLSPEHKIIHIYKD